MANNRNNLFAVASAWLKGKSQTFLRTILLVLFVVFMVSPEIAAKQDNSISGGKNKKGNKISFSFTTCLGWDSMVVWNTGQWLSKGNPLSNGFSLKCILFISVRERAVSSESCNLIGFGSGQNFLSLTTVMVTAAKTTEWNLKNNVPSVELWAFFYLRLKDANFLPTHNSYVCCKWKV